MLIVRCAWLLFALCAHAASLIPTSASDSFPQCALDCSALQQAQDSCTAGPQSSWTSCFCESALLTSLKSSGSLCTSCTATADQSLLSSWYNSYCRSGGNGDTNKAAGNTAATTATTTTSATTAGATNTASSANSSKATAAEEHPSWWSTHYKWVIMLIVLAVAFSFIAALGVWLKRRHDARHAQLYRQPATSVNVGGPSASTSGVLTPAPGTYAPPAAALSQSRSPAPDSVASSSRTDFIAPKGVAPPSRSRLHKTAQSAAADVEIRQVSRP